MSYHIQPCWKQRKTMAGLKNRGENVSALIYDLCSSASRCIAVMEKWVAEALAIGDKGNAAV